MLKERKKQKKGAKVFHQKRKENKSFSAQLLHEMGRLEHIAARLAFICT
jgi:hypothetical protein